MVRVSMFALFAIAAPCFTMGSPVKVSFSNNLHSSHVDLTNVDVSNVALGETTKIMYNLGRLHVILKILASNYHAASEPGPALVAIRFEARRTMPSRRQ